MSERIPDKVQHLMDNMNARQLTIAEASLQAAGARTHERDRERRRNRKKAAKNARRKNRR